MDIDHIRVLFSVLLIWVVVITTYVVAARRDKRVPADDIGVLWLAVLALYATLPSLSWLFQGGSYSVFGDARLPRLQPNADQVAYLLNIALAYACGFAALYYLLGRRVRGAAAWTHTPISGAKMAGALVVVLLFQIAMLVASMGGFVGSADSYIESYRIVRELPLAARQVLKIAAGIASVATLVLLIAVLQRWPRHRLLFILLVAIVLLSFDVEGSRAAVVTGLFSVAIAWHVLVNPIPGRWWFAGGAFGLVLFLAAGFRRALGSWAEIGVAGPDVLGVGEFESLWANAIELLQARESGGLDIPATARFGEFWAFIPSQMLPFEKLALSDWFVQTFYPVYYEAGGGLAFGAIGQAVIGGGVMEAVFRGAILGAVAAWLMKWYRTPPAPWWRLPVYLYLLVFAFQAVRDTTFRPLGDVVQTVLPALLLVALTGSLLATPRSARRTARAAWRRSST